MIPSSIMQKAKVNPILNTVVCIQYPEFEISSLLKTGSNSNPENLNFGIHESGIKFISKGLIVV